jgi:predicted small integral membrane protein
MDKQHIISVHAVEQTSDTQQAAIGMFETWQMIRLSKILWTFSLGCMFILVVFNNLSDYQTNFQFVRNIMMMSWLPEGNTNAWRTLTHPAWHHIFYGCIILWELLSALFCVWGAARCFSARNASQGAFHRAKNLALLGLLLSTLLWLFAFLIVGGEWFLMWQSQMWNASASAFRFFAVSALGLIFVSLPEQDVTI